MFDNPFSFFPSCRAYEHGHFEMTSPFFNIANLHFYARPPVTGGLFQFGIYRKDPLPHTRSPFIRWLNQRIVNLYTYVRLPFPRIPPASTILPEAPRQNDAPDWHWTHDIPRRPSLPIEDIPDASPGAISEEGYR